MKLFLKIHHGKGKKGRVKAQRAEACPDAFGAISSAIPSSGGSCVQADRAALGPFEVIKRRGFVGNTQNYLGNQSIRENQKKSAQVASGRGRKGKERKTVSDGEQFPNGGDG